MGIREAGAVSKFSFAGQISHGFISIDNDLEGARSTALLAGMLEEQNVVLVVFYMKESIPAHLYIAETASRFRC